MRYGINEESYDETIQYSWIDTEHTNWTQITTSNGLLRGIIEIGAEGFDVSARDYWDCILVPPEADRLVFISFNIRGKWSNRHDDTSVFWPASMKDANEDEIIEKQQEMITDFARSITLP